MKGKIKSQLIQILKYLEKATPAELVNKKNDLRLEIGMK